MAALLIWYHSIVLCTSKGDISASAFLSLDSYFLAYWYIGRPSHVSLATSMAFLVAFISVCPICCNTLRAKDSKVLGCGHEHALLRSYVSLGLFGSPFLWVGCLHVLQSGKINQFFK